MYRKLDTKELIVEISEKNNENAFRELFERYFPRLVQYALSIVKSSYLAEDVVLDMFTHLWEKRDSLVEVTSIEKFLYVSTKNKAIDNLRSKKELLSLDAGSDNYKEFITLRDPEKLLIEEELFNTINEAVLALPEKCKLVYLMVKEEGLKYKEVAELLDISPKTVDNQVNTAMKKIRGVVLEYLSHSDPGYKDYLKSVLLFFV